MSKIRLQVKTKILKQIREAVANYMSSEGCSCCEHRDHEEHKRVLAKILNVPQYADKSGYDFHRFVREARNDRK